MFCLTCCRRKNVDHLNEKQDENKHIESDDQMAEYCNVPRERSTDYRDSRQDSEYSEVRRDKVSVVCESEYADVNAIVGLNGPGSVTMATYSVAAPSSKGHVKVKQVQKTIGEDGTLYADVSHQSVGSMKAKGLKSQPSYSRSEYASIDHTVKPHPAPPKTKLKTKTQS